ncbi:hypothetical protein ACFRFE_37410, partial [Streptomyces sp. NPDC056683]
RLIGRERNRCQHTPPGVRPSLDRLHHQAGRHHFLNQAIRRAELDHPELTSEFELYFHALEDAFDLQLPRQDIQQGTVRAAQWAHRNS